MKDLVLCKSCVEYRPKDGSILRVNANGRKQVRCALCVEKVKKAKVKL